MHRVTISLTDEILEKVDNKAKKEKTSRSACISELITFGITGNKSDEEVNRLNAEVENLKLRTEDLGRSLRWLEGEYSKMNDSLVRKALPGGFFSKLKFWGKR